MKRKYIYILPIAGVTSVAAAIAPTITSCSCSKTSFELDEWSDALMGSGGAGLCKKDLSIQKGIKYKFTIDLTKFQTEFVDNDLWIFIAMNDDFSKVLLPTSVTMQVNNKDVSEITVEQFMQQEAGYIIANDEEGGPYGGVVGWKKTLDINSLNSKVVFEVVYDDSLDSGTVGFAKFDLSI